MTKERNTYAKPQGVIKLKTEAWETNCGDGCCYDCGTDLYCNGKNLGIELDYSNLSHAVTSVITEVGLSIDQDIQAYVNFLDKLYEFKTKNAMDEFLDNFSKLDELEEWETLWSYFNPVVEIFFLNLYCKELDNKKVTQQNGQFTSVIVDEYQQELVIINDYILPVVGSEEDNEFEIFEKLVKVLELIGFEVEVEQ